ncbi:hypothetical protein PM082_024020 [Marasmius tenuissimus]|nr:hypothetical protein PM082_024020 [Marasmius tenuissimus]
MRTWTWLRITINRKYNCLCFSWDVGTLLRYSIRAVAVPIMNVNCMPRFNAISPRRPAQASQNGSVNPRYIGD